MGTQDLIDNLEVVILHLRNAETAPDIHTEVLATLWQANVVVEQQGARWINAELESAYGKFAALEHPAELPSDGHREQWRRARNHICQEAEQFAASARKELDERSASSNGGAIEEIGQAVAKALEDGKSLEPLARATEVMAYQLGEGIQIS
jgi:hypothetical protein